MLLKNKALILITCALALSCTSQKKADLIVYNAKIYTVDPSFTTAKAMVITNGTITNIGSNAMIKEYKADKTINLEGKYIYPGFIDPHCHFYGYSKTLSQIDLRGTTSFEEMIEKLIIWDKENNPEWITGRGWDQNLWPDKTFPNKQELDKIFPNKPVFLRRIDGHAAIANSKAMQLAGIDANTKIKGGEVKTKNGKTTGMLIDNAMQKIFSIVPELNKSDMTQLLDKAAKNCFEVGLTTVADAGLEFHEIMLLDSLQKFGNLEMQIYAMLSASKNNFENFIQKGEYKTKKLHIKSIKLFADGALGSRGACLLKPYTDDNQNYGLILEPIETYDSILKMAYDNNYQVNTHAIGDSANRLILNLYGKHLKAKNDRRWRIEHAQAIHPNDFQKFGRYSIIPAINTTQATSDMYWAESRLGANRIKTAYAYAQLLKENMWLCNGSDFPVEQINPLYGFYAAVSRKDFNNQPENGFQPENSLTRMQALKAMTIWAAKSIFQENEKGSLEKGKNADFVVLPNDIMTTNISDVPKTKVLATYISGKQTFGVN